MSWRQPTIEIQYNHDRLNAIMNKLGINSDGTFRPLTWLQYLMYGNAKNRLLAKLKQCKLKAQLICNHLNTIMDKQQNLKDLLLIQYFILEQCECLFVRLFVCSLA